MTLVLAKWNKGIAILLLIRRLEVQDFDSFHSTDVDFNSSVLTCHLDMFLAVTHKSSTCPKPGSQKGKLAYIICKGFGME